MREGVEPRGCDQPGGGVSGEWGRGLREGAEPRGLDQWEGVLSPQWAGLRVWGRGLARGRG